MKLEQLIGFILTRGEQIEEEAKQQSALRDLTYRQLYCLTCIAELKNPTPSLLAKELSITKPSTTALVEKLVKKELVKKVPSNKDRRVAYLHLTVEGRKLIRLHHSVHSEFATQLTKNLSESEKDILAYLLSKAVDSW